MLTYVTCQANVCCVHQLSEGYVCCATCREVISKNLATQHRLFVFNCRVLQSISWYLFATVSVNGYSERSNPTCAPLCIPHSSHQQSLKNYLHLSLHAWEVPRYLHWFGYCKSYTGNRIIELQSAFIFPHSERTEWEISSLLLAPIQSSALRKAATIRSINASRALTAARSWSRTRVAKQYGNTNNKRITATCKRLHAELYLTTKAYVSDFISFGFKVAEIKF